ncbi:hypothetical protein SASPL_117367 [Salvia splendens]|uniref:Uncharacterized protein n=1 Tax=Salvia splendens TaxID=180675 RepID=A0A8X8XUQ6_SALSN|nr:hypothetical protein SASPL_117367 [Salvia splendens]
MDKAAPLGHVVDHVKEQRQRAKEASKISSGVPSEIDEVIVDQIEDGSEQIKSSICCDDRPELFAEIGSALKALEATIVNVHVCVEMEMAYEAQGTPTTDFRFPLDSPSSTAFPFAKPEAWPRRLTELMRLARMVHFNTESDLMFQPQPQRRTVAGFRREEEKLEWGGKRRENRRDET